MMTAEQLAELWYQAWTTQYMTNNKFDEFDKQCLDNGVDPEIVMNLIEKNYLNKHEGELI